MIAYNRTRLKYFYEIEQDLLKTAYQYDQDWSKLAKIFNTKRGRIQERFNDLMFDLCLIARAIQTNPNNVPVRSLTLPPNVYKALREEAIVMLEDLVKLDRDALLDLKGLGNKGRVALLQEMHEHGFEVWVSYVKGNDPVACD